MSSPAPSSPLPRRFLLYRHDDVTGKSGTGVVAEGAQWTDGSATLRWRGEHPATSVWPNVEEILAVHGHEGATEVVWLSTYFPHLNITALIEEFAPGTDDIEKRRFHDFADRLIELAELIEPDIQDEAVRACRVCGCTDEFACDGGCFWVEPDLCSSCPPYATPDDARRRELWATYGQPTQADAAAALAALDLGEVDPADVVACAYRDQEAADAYAAANLEHWGHPSLGTYETEDGVVGVLDLRPAIARLSEAEIAAGGADGPDTEVQG